MTGTPSEPPTVNSLLIAERVFRDRESNEWIIAGVFNSIQVPKVPYLHPQLDVFFQLTNVGQNVDLQFRVEHADSGDVVVEFGGPVTSANPLHVVEQRVALRRLRLKREGKYWVQLLSREEILTQAPLHIIVVPGATNGDGDDEDDQ